MIENTLWKYKKFEEIDVDKILNILQFWHSNAHISPDEIFFLDKSLRYIEINFWKIKSILVKNSSKSNAKGNLLCQRISFLFLQASIRHNDLRYLNVAMKLNEVKFSSFYFLPKASVQLKAAIALKNENSQFIAKQIKQIEK